MRPRQPLPKIWMFSDERMGDAFLPALARLPKGNGLVFRHHGLAKAERQSLFDKARVIARKRRILVVLAGSAGEARAWKADGVHQSAAPSARRHLRTAPVHNLRELIAAERGGADLIFLSPAFVTRSHPGGRTLGGRGFAALARKTKTPVIALGGMTAQRARAVKGAYGWAAIDAFMEAG